MRFAKFCYTELNMGICIKTVIVLSSYFGILQSASEQQTGVYLRLKGRTNFTDSLIPIHEIGITTNEITHPNIDEAENNGLQCVTDKPNCCRVGSRIRIGEWYFPDGTRVPILDHGSNRATSFFRNRGNNDSTVNLNRVSSDIASPTGQFCCRVPDSMDRNQTVCVNITSITFAIVPLGTSIAGENFTLQCSVEGAGDFLTRIEWLNSDLIGGVNIETDGSRIQLQFIPLKTSHGEVYTCQATVGDKNFTENYTLHVNPIMAPSSPQFFNAVSDTTTVLFTWAIPLHPIMVVNYTLTCVPLSEGVDPLIMISTEAGSYTLGGFRPATVYNCSIVATNCIGSSAPSVINITTVDQSSQFHFWLMKIDNCTEWMVTNAGQKLNNISSAIVDNIENRCQCRFIRDRITDEAFQCTDNALEAVAYAATVHGTASVNSSLLISHIEQWATDGATVTVLHEVLNISNMGPTKGECCTEMTVTKEVTSYESSDHYSEEVTSSESSDHYSQEVTSSELSDHYTEEVISSESSDHYSQKVTSSKSSDHYTEEVTSSESSDHYTEEVTSSESFNHYSEEVTSSESSLNETQAKPKDNDHTLFIIIGGGSGGGVVIIVIIIIVVIAVIVKCKSRKHGKLRIHKTELVQEEKELNRYENLCVSRLQEGVYIEECDYGEIKGQHRGQEDREDVSHHHHHSATNEYEESTKLTQRSDEPEYENIMKSHPDDQSQATSHQQSVLPLNKLAIDKYKSHQSATATKHQMPREGTYNFDEEVYDDIQPHQPKGKDKHDPYHPGAMEGCTENKLDCQNDYNYTAIPQSSAAGTSTRYQPLLSRESDYENNLKDYNSINESHRRDYRGSDEEYEYVVTNPRYYYRPSVK